MEVLNLTRKFRYNSVTLPDPNDSMSPDQVREFYATQFPELNNALIEGPTTANGVSTWQFVRAAGAKGRDESTPIRQITDARKLINLALEAGTASALPPTPFEGETNRYVGRLVQVICSRSSGGRAMSPPSSAFGIWG